MLYTGELNIAQTLDGGLQYSTVGVLWVTEQRETVAQKSSQRGNTGLQ